MNIIRKSQYMLEFKLCFFGVSIIIDINNPFWEHYFDKKEVNLND